MKTSCQKTALGLLLAIPLGAAAATLYVDLNSPSPTAPYSSWSTAATNIQDAIDAAAPGDLVLVTNGVYATGGKVMFGDLTNRVALDKAITVQSVNGPWFTTIRGNGATNGLNAVRCAWITNGATLQGFTLTAGATRAGGDQTNAMSGGGALCIGANAVVQNCLVISNVAQTLGGGVYQGVVANTAIIGNRASGSGSGAANAALVNCTVISNWQATATIQCQHTNSIVYYNSSGNHVGGTFAYSCTTPAAPGIGNIATAPQLFSDGIHLQSTSPCRGAGTNLTTGADIDGEAWGNPPSIGCDEWGGKPIIISQPRIQLTNNPIGFAISVTVAGEDPLAYYWVRNGFPIVQDERFSQAASPQLVATGVGEWSVGDYQVVVSNSFGMVTSAVAQLTARFVNVSNSFAAWPFTSWANAATNIQDAIDAAASGEIVLVTNGIYRSGGKAMGGDLTNRVALDKATIVQSINGPEATIIEGNWNPTVTNGPAAVRCAWLTNNAVLAGFTLRGGATRVSSSDIHGSGGGVYGSSTNATLENCVISTNLASHQGGGAFQVTLRKCALIGNRAVGTVAGALGAGRGGGAYLCHILNSVIRFNSAGSADGGGVSGCSVINSALSENSSRDNGSGAYGGRLLNCTVVNNTVTGPSGGSAVYLTVLTNCIVWDNRSAPVSILNTNHSSSTFAFSCTLPVPAGPGNIGFNPLLLVDNIHLAHDSPCRAAGTPVATSLDIDNQSWANPPAMGCDEWSSAPFIAGTPGYSINLGSRSLVWNISATGQSPLSYAWFKDETSIQNNSHYLNADAPNLDVLKFGPEDAGGYRVVISNAFGVATSQVVQVVIHCADAAGGNPVFPYSSWATAAPVIQQAIDAAQANAIILVTNGVYVTGGRIMSGDLLNRVVIDKPLTVMSMNGYKSAVIQGVWDAATNGPAAVRCVWMTNGALLAGFTIRNGATRTTGDSAALQSGGGVWTPTFYGGASLANCLFTNNSAGYLGGGIYGGAVKNSIFVENYGNIGGNAGGGGGAAAYSDLRNCTVNYNFCPLSSQGAGVYGSRVYNSIVQGNYRGSPFGFDSNYSPSFNPTIFAYSSAWPLPSGVGNTTTWPIFLDWDYHLPAVSPARGIGSSLYSSGEDLDGEAWANPPSIGADEVVDANLVGPLTLSVNAWRTNTLVGSFHALTFWAAITGRVSRIDWSFGDGVVATNVGAGSPIHWWTNAGTFTITCTAYNNDNPGGVSASIIIEVLPLIAPGLQSVALQTNGFKFAFEAQEGARYTVQYATNLAAPVTWNTLQTIFFSPGGPTQITDPAWTNAARFYRVLAQ
jgi:hypothetical protein